MDGQKKTNQHGWTWIELDGHGQEQCGYTEAAWTWMAVVLARQAPGTLPPPDAVEAFTVLALERVADIHVRHEMFVASPRRLIAEARCRQAVAQPSTIHLRVLI
jgi:hypothetical protein